MNQGSTELVVVSALVPADVFAPGGVEAIIKSVVDKVRAIETDISTPTGRRAVAALAYKVARSKTALDDMGKTLVASLKAQTSAIDAERRTIREHLDALQHEVRKPLTDWEDTEKRRVEEHELALDGILEHPQWGITETSADIRKRLNYLENYPAREWQEFSARAAKSLASEIERARALLAAAEKREAEHAEAERLLHEQAEREQRDRDERIAREAAERARAETEEKAARAQVLADARAREAEARAAQADADRIASEGRAREEAALAVSKAEAAMIAAAKKAEREKVIAIATERQRVAAEQNAVAAAAARREANKKYLARVNNAARDALVAAGLTTEQATIAVTAIAKGDVPNVKISY